MPFTSILPPAKPGPGQFLASRSKVGSVIIRDQLKHTTWLLLGACFHAVITGILSMLLPKSALYISAILFAILAYYIGTAMLQAYGIIPNPEMAGVIDGLVTAQVPDVDGTMPSAPAQEGIVVMFLGFKSNHPLKAFAPGAKEVGKHFRNMLHDLDTPESREKFGILGMSAYIGTSSETSNEYLHVMYWRNIQGVHAFAESAVHRAAWDYWNHTVKEHPHLSISHEIYYAEGGNHENIYGNAKPTLIGGTAFAKSSDEKHEEEWISPLVDANRGILRTSKGRLGWRSHGTNKDSYGY